MPTSGPGTPTATPTSGLGTPTATPTSGPGTPTATPTITPTAAPAATSTPTQTPLPDTDSDGVPDASDNCPTVPNPHQISTDTDTSCRLIDNNDGTVADMDNGLM
ncbi:MAG: hypothetical protein GY794_10430 [bacterium]|nr:hypothetical protein [bacterium]